MKYDPTTGSVVLDYRFKLYTGVSSFAGAFSFAGGFVNDIAAFQTSAVGAFAPYETVKAFSAAMGKVIVPFAASMAFGEYASRLSERDYSVATLSLAANASGIYGAALVGDAAIGLTGSVVAGWGDGCVRLAKLILSVDDRKHTCLGGFALVQTRHDRLNVSPENQVRLIHQGGRTKSP